MVVLQSRKKESSAYHCSLGGAARGDCPIFPIGIAKSA